MMNNHTTIDGQRIASVVRQAIDHRFCDCPEETPTWALALQLGTVDRAEVSLEVQFAHLWLWVQQYEREERIRSDLEAKPRRDDIHLVRSWIERQAGAEVVGAWRRVAEGAVEGAIASAHDAAVGLACANRPPAGWLVGHAARENSQRPKPRRPQ